MPAQKRRLSSSPSSRPRDHVETNGMAASSSSSRAAGGSGSGGGGGGGGSGGGVSQAPRGGAAAKRTADPQPQREGDSDAEFGGGVDGDSESSQSDGDMDEFIVVKLAEIRKEVQCPICLGIIRKTRTVMECLHRFCRDCIDKSMRLGNNECPACRTHCASRRSLRDDPNYDALIAALYPDIDKYEEEELAFSEEERSRNKKIQATIEETIRRQSEAVGKKRSTAKATATVFARKYRRNMRTRGRAKTVVPDIAPTGSDDEGREEANAIDATKESSSADDHCPDLRPKRGRKRPASRASPARTIGSSDNGFEETDELIGGKESFTTSPLRGEMLAWGKNGARSQTRHGSVGGSNGRMAKSGRVAKLVDHLRTTDDMDKQFNLHLVLLPLDEQSTPNLEKPYISCRPTLSIRHLVQFIALQLSLQVEELELFMRMDRCIGSVATKDSIGNGKMRISDGLERIGEDKLLLELHPSVTSHHGDLELLYALKAQG
ncbi:putative E3 ubiquitin-protein ligase RING1a [Oryza brachyantha]|uniref:putative E3 ubiquitin-protein ligase RING1a n=1 Tax=Oryza brachyantha TaxID=4533 RepID=UPI001AD9EF11|nr:putative E3 ubiquitin-protein ligase RING1a [Oryza brachyantha]